MNNDLNSILQECTNGLKEIFGNDLRQVILYGSHARGDFDSESDIDVMVLVEMSDEDIMTNRERITELGAEISYNNDIMLSIIVKDIEHFNSWLPVYPLYKTIKREGVEVFG
ncbi:MAG: nucleotidyltransferase domain-containing protein [Oscillospiraceae bacterium]|nr:nucleotidyltransferase domain-containing protein [Oscillospiraceae bacterium]